MANTVNSLEVADILDIRPYYVTDLMRRHGFAPVGTFESGLRGRPALTWKRGDVTAVKTARATKSKKAARPAKQKPRTRKATTGITF